MEPTDPDHTVPDHTVPGHTAPDHTAPGHAAADRASLKAVRKDAADHLELPPDLTSQHPVLDALLRAEVETGAQESSFEQARAHLLVRLARISAGCLVLVAGLLFMALPLVPGWVLVLAGLSILSVDVPFAARLRDRLLVRASRVGSGISKLAKVVFVVLAVTASFAISLGLFLLR